MSTNPNSNLNQNLQQRNKKRFNFTWIYLIIGVILMAIYLFGGSNNGKTKEIDDVQFKKMVLNKDIKELMYTQKDQKIYLFLKEKSVETKADYKDLRDNLKGPQYYLNISDYKVFNDNLNIMIEDQVDAMMQDSTIQATKSKRDLKDSYVFPMKQDTTKDWGTELIWWMLPILLIFVFFYFSMRSMRGGAGGGGLFSIGKSKAQLFDEKSTLNISFKDVAGLEGAKYEVEEIVDFLKNPQKYTELGGKIPRGALLVGPPGTGKTLLARAVAGEAKVPFFSLSGSDFVEMFVGVGASRVRDLFKTAKEKAPCIIFIDEIDAIGRARGRNVMSGANDERENTLNQLLTEMDGFSPNAGVIILAATNRADILDRALLRAGRFDRQIHVELPNVNERKGIFEVHVRRLKLGADVDLDFFAKQTPGFSGADIANICNEAALIAARNTKKEIEKEDFLAAIDRIVGGLEKRGSMITPHEKKVIAYHESGHASVSWLLEHASPLVKVTIVPRGKSLGAAWYLPEERQITTFEQMFDEMTALLGGRAAEDVAFGKISTGALNDLERVTKQAYSMIVYFGLNEKIGNLSYYDSSGQSEYSFNKPYSEKTAEEIDNQMRILVESAYQRAKNILQDNKEKLDLLATLLVDKEVIFAEDLENIFGKRAFDKEGKHIISEEQPKIEDNDAKEADRV
ncbi:MAG TPA: ATP-dependent zinc metalloprotease FtsH [Bacteroidales bacterium]|nr:ATP-dependent zinc metalloprotease FtsH [Bacteroidales bacterium]HPT51798.1 ATP-dependent zinc metalloprotease FtsH [Bacteroidales bacterium]